MRSLAIFGALVALVGCPGPGEEPSSNADAGSAPGIDAAIIGTQKTDLYQSGSRIKARMLTTVDGAKSFLGWRDTQRNENCTFRLAADGKYRCLPATFAGEIGWYLDAACTTAIFSATARCPAPAWLRVADDACGGTGERIFSPQPLSWTNGMEIYSLNGATCTGSFPVSAPAGLVLFTAGAEAPLSGFQEGGEDLE